jgi:hypothetical protein
MIQIKMTFQLKHIKGIPYYLRNSIVYTFELTNGFPSENCIPIGDYDEPSDSITYYPDWLQRVQPNLEAFRSQIKVIERDKLRENVSKPQKPRKAAPNPRKGGRAKSVKSEKE